MRDGGVKIGHDEPLDRRRLGNADVLPAHPAQDRGTGEAEIDDLRNQREDAEARRLAFRARPGRARPDLAGASVNWGECADEQTVEGRGSLEHFAQDEARDWPRLGARDNGVDQGLDDAGEPVTSLAPRETFDFRRSALRPGEDLANGRGDIVRAGQAQPLLSSEVLGNQGDVDPGRRGDLSRRGRFETFGSEEFKPRPDKRGTRRLGAG